MKEGEGILYISNGEKFVGEFHNDVISGKGAFTTLTGDRIHGEWKDNLLSKRFWKLIYKIVHEFFFVV